MKIIFFLLLFISSSYCNDYIPKADSGKTVSNVNYYNTHPATGSSFWANTAILLSAIITASGVLISTAYQSRKQTTLSMKLINAQINNSSHNDKMVKINNLVADVLALFTKQNLYIGQLSKTLKDEDLKQEIAVEFISTSTDLITQYKQLFYMLSILLDVNDVENQKLINLIEKLNTEYWKDFQDGKVSDKNNMKIINELIREILITTRNITNKGIPIIE